VAAQAAHPARAVSAVIGGSGDPGAASDGLRTYMMMLLIGAPVLIGTRSRRFLERAQYLGGNGPHARGDRSPEGAAVPGGRLDESMQLQSAAAPLLGLLSPETRDSFQRIGQTAEK
jgi:hypothetical protein